MNEIRQTLEILQAKHKQLAEVVLQISENIRTHPDASGDTYQLIIKATQALTDADDAAICLLDPLKNHFKIYGTASLSVSPKWKAHFKDSVQGLSNLILQQQQLETVADTFQDKRIHPLVRKTKIRSILGVPVGKIGVLYAYCSKPHYFDEAANLILQVLASQASLAAYSQYSSIIEHMMHRASETLNLREPEHIPEHILELISHIIPCDTASIQILERDQLHLEYGWGFDPQVFKQEIRGRTFRLDDDSAPNGKVVRDQSPVFITDAPAEYPSFRQARYQRIKAWIGVPMLLAQEVIGIITLDKETPGFYNAEHARIAQAFATQAAVALYRMQAYTQMKYSLEKLQEAAYLVYQGEIDQALRSIMLGVKGALQCDVVALHFYDYTKQMVTRPPIMVGTQIDWDVNELVRAFRDSPPDRIFRLPPEQKEYFAGDSSNDPIMRGKFAREEKVRSSAACRFDIGDNLSSVLFVNYRYPHTFTEDNKRLLRMFTTQAQVAVHNALLYERERKHLERLQTLRKATQLVAESVDKDEILNTLLRQACETTGISGKPPLYACILLYNPSRDELEFTHAWPQEELSNLREKMGHQISLKAPSQIGIAGRAARTKEIQLVEDVLLNRDYISYHPKTASEIAVPLLDNQKELLGVLNIEHAAIRGLNEQDKEFLETLAQQAAVAIQRIKQTQELETSTALAVSEIIYALWGHDTSNKISTMKNWADNIRSALQTENISAIEPMAGKIIEIAQTIEKFPESFQDAMESVYINPFLRPLVEDSSRWKTGLEIRQILGDQNRLFITRLENWVSVRAERNTLRKALDNLFDNAAKAMRDVRHKQLTVTARQDENWVEILIEDTGQGIPTEIRDELFKIRIPKSPGEAGRGTGALVTRTIIRAYGGDVSVDRTGPKGTTIIVRLPVEKSELP